MVREAIITPYPPRSHYSRGIKTEQFIFTAGTVGDQNLDTGEKIGGIEAQTRQALETIKEILKLGGSSLDNVADTTVYITNRDDFLKMNEVYKTYFLKDPPTRTTLIVGLRPGVLVEIKCIACRSYSV
ncbi:RidA family protein [Chloroflexota bacterium]